MDSHWIRPRPLFPKNLMNFFGWTLWMFWPSLKCVASPVFEIIAIRFLGAGCEPPFLGKRRPLVVDWWSRMTPFERALVSSYRPSIVTFPLSIRVSEILPLLCSSTPLFPTPPLVSSKFPHAALSVYTWMSFGLYEERRYWANCKGEGAEWERGSKMLQK